ncbi:MAG: VIT domain-containing protein, partial [Acidobacteriota bacterium]|nr:VIT domain-containing protein [Acidobacteriota bacterium]
MSGSRAWMIRTIWILTITSTALAGLEGSVQEDPLAEQVLEVENEGWEDEGDETCLGDFVEEVLPAGEGLEAIGVEEPTDKESSAPVEGAAPVHALQEDNPPQGVGLDEVQHAALLFAGGAGGTYLPAPVLDTEYEIRITGLIVRARVTQRFANRGAGFVDGLYVFPLPESAAVDHLVMTVGDRRIEGRIQERGRAEKTYQQAKDEGKKASLVRQHRPNIFTTAVANIGPAEEIVVEIEYQQAARYDAGEFSLRVPLAITRRFTPPPSGRNLLADGRPGP